MIYAGFFFYPKWKKSHTEATIGWDVSGYYMYLPATFIYADLKKCGFKDEILEKYRPTPDWQQGFVHEKSGNNVMKYSLGQSIQFLPFFAVGHFIAKIGGWPADGFSAPYQFMISIEAFFVAFLGLWFLRLILLRYFDEAVTATTLAAIVFATNYLDYSAINGAMTHNNLFTIYAILIYNCILFYENPKTGRALIIGGLVGLAALTRPTEIISCLIPIFWGLNIFSKDAIAERFDFFKTHFSKLLKAVIVVALIGSLQLFYWKYVSGDWIVYSYEDQGFSWLKPHLHGGLLSYKSGWLTYSPIMVFSLLGFFFMFRNKKFLSVAFLFSFLFIYIAFAWDEWWYGGSLGQRSMVQAYPVLALPLAICIKNMFKVNFLKSLFVTILLIFTYYNLWLTYNAHGGSMYHAGYMTKEYFWKVVGTTQFNENDLKLLDTDEEFLGKQKNTTEVYRNFFEQDTSTYKCHIPLIEGNNSFFLNKEKQYSPKFTFPVDKQKGGWIRSSATFRCHGKEWDTWRMSQFLVYFEKDGKKVKERMIRIFRVLHDGQTKRIHFDTQIPEEDFDTAGLFFWNAESDKTLVIDEIVVEQFQE